MHSYQYIYTELITYCLENILTCPRLVRDDLPDIHIEILEALYFYPRWKEGEYFDMNVLIYTPVYLTVHRFTPN